MTSLLQIRCAHDVWLVICKDQWLSHVVASKLFKLHDNRRVDNACMLTLTMDRSAYKDGAVLSHGCAPVCTAWMHDAHSSMLVAPCPTTSSENLKQIMQPMRPWTQLHLQSYSTSLTYLRFFAVMQTAQFYGADDASAAAMHSIAHGAATASTSPVAQDFLQHVTSLLVCS